MAYDNRDNHPLSSGCDRDRFSDATDDVDLIAAVSVGQSQALELLYDRYASIVYRMALRTVRSPELAEEIVQEVFWRVWRRSMSFERERGKVPQWIFGITHNLCIDELRRIQARPKAIYNDDNHPIFQQLADGRVDVLDTAWMQERRRFLEDALEHLPVAQRQAIELAYFGGMTHQEIATKLNRPLGTIKTRVRLGLQKLHSLLSARGLQAIDVW